MFGYKRFNEVIRRFDEITRQQSILMAQFLILLKKQNKMLEDLARLEKKEDGV